MDRRILVGARIAASLVSVAGLAFGQGVLDRLPGAFTLVGQATNDAGTVFIELDTSVNGMFGAVKAGMLEEGVDILVIIAPNITHIGRVKDGAAYYESLRWYDLVQLSRRDPVFALHSLTYSQVSDLRLNPEYIAAALSRPQTVVTFGGGPSCASSSTSAGSSFSCYDGGRLTYRSTCTTDSVTGAISCRGTYY